jgi:hypothetical protein
VAVADTVASSMPDAPSSCLEQRYPSKEDKDTLVAARKTLLRPLYTQAVKSKAGVTALYLAVAPERMLATNLEAAVAVVAASFAPSVPLSHLEQGSPGKEDKDTQVVAAAHPPLWWRSPNKLTTTLMRWPAWKEDFRKEGQHASSCVNNVVETSPPPSNKVHGVCHGAASNHGAIDNAGKQKQQQQLLLNFHLLLI